jgi:hypothetical protein
MTGPWLATCTFDAVFPNGPRQRVHFRVGFPYRTEEPGEWACAVQLEGLGLDEPDCLGSDSMQALCLALCSAGRRMRDLQEAGVVFTERGEDIAFDWTDYFDLFPASDEQR